jgi:hypothetical protein
MQIPIKSINASIYKRMNYVTQLAPYTNLKPEIEMKVKENLKLKTLVTNYIEVSTTPKATSCEAT